MGKKKSHKSKRGKQPHKSRLSKLMEKLNREADVETANESNSEVDQVAVALPPADEVHPLVKEMIDLHALRPEESPFPHFVIITRNFPCDCWAFWMLDLDYVHLAETIFTQYRIQMGDKLIIFEPVVKLVQWCVRWPMLHGPARNRLEGDDVPLGTYSKSALIYTTLKSNLVKYCETIVGATGYEPLTLDSSNVLGENCVRRLVEAGNVFRWRRMIILDVDDLLKIFELFALVNLVETISNVLIPIVYVTKRQDFYLDDVIAEDFFKVQIRTHHPTAATMFVPHILKQGYVLYRKTIGAVTKKSRNALMPTQYMQIAMALTTDAPEDRTRLPMVMGDLVYVTNQLPYDLDGLWEGWCMGRFGVFLKFNVWTK